MSYSGRYQNALTYNPGRQTGVYRQYSGGSRNALADMLPQPQDNPPFSVMQRPAASGGTLAGGTGSLAGGTGALTSGGGGYIQSGAGDSAQGEYGGPGPEGAKSTGNFGQDLAGLSRAAGPAMASIAFGGPMGIASVALGAMAAGALRAAGMDRAANSLATATFGSPFGGTPSIGTSVENTSTTGDETGGQKSDTVGNVSPDNPADAGKDFGDQSGVAGTSNENTSTGGEQGGDKAGTSGDVGADSPAFRHGGYTGDDEDGDLEPIRATLHEGEFVLRPEAVRMYGVDTLHAMNRGQLPRNALAGAMARPVTAANHLLQRMRG